MKYKKNEIVTKKKKERKEKKINAVLLTEQDVDEIVTISNKEPMQVCF